MSPGLPTKAVAIQGASSAGLIPRAVTTRSWARLLWVFVMLHAGCERRYLSDGLPRDVTCSSCHGAPTNPGPPKALGGASDTSDVGVGAHQEHLLGSRIAGPVACEECHPVPSEIDDDGHLDLRTDVVFGPLANRLGASAGWDRASTRCTNTYCHGSTLAGADSRPDPEWTRVDRTYRACDACHGNPPSGDAHADHDFMSCGDCHAPVMDAASKFAQPALHVDGSIQVSMPSGGTWNGDAKTCASTGTACHGNGAYPW